MRDDIPFETSTFDRVRSRAVSLALLLLPPAILAVAAVGAESRLAAVGAVSQLLAGLLLLRHRHVWRPPASASLILLYLMALGWLWFATRPDPDALARVGRGVLLLAAVGLLIGHDLVRTGLEPRRRGRAICRRLLRRVEWPAAVPDYALIPDVRALADALQDDASPAVELLHDARREVRIAAFTALQGRPYWRAGEAELVLTAVQRTQDPQVRAVGILALGRVDDGEILLLVAGYLRDKSAEVRQATLTALLADPARRWPLLRDPIREALSDPHLAKDGALAGAAGKLDGVAVCDFTAWAAEPPPLGARSLQTLVAHYGFVLNAGGHFELPAEIGRQITDAQTPPEVRVELAGLLRSLGMITPDLLDRMTDVDQPGPLRVLAAEMLLAWNPANPDAIDVLRGLGRQSNRETALVIARLVQKYLGVDLGLPQGAMPTNTKQAAEVAKRVFQWATGRAAPEPPPPPPDDVPAWVASGPRSMPPTRRNGPR